jgi:hypothetical protein
MLRKVSWVLLVLVGALTLLGSVLAARGAYSSNDYPIGGTPLSEVAAGREAVATALRGVRGTAAAWAAGFATLFLAVVLGPYRRGDVASWWALLLGTLAFALVTLARVPSLGLRAGAGTALVLLGLVLLALLLDVGRVRGH